MFCQQFRAETAIWLCCYEQNQQTKSLYFHGIKGKHQNSLLTSAPLVLCRLVHFSFQRGRNIFSGLLTFQLHIY